MGFQWPDGVAGDGQRGGARINFDLRPDWNQTVARGALLEVERAGLRRIDDRQAEWRAVVRAGEIDLAAGDGERVATEAHADRRFADETSRAARSCVGLGFPTQRHAGEDPGQAGGMCSEIAFRLWLPSSRLIVIVNGLKAPAWLLVAPAVSEGANGSVSSD